LLAIKRQAAVAHGCYLYYEREKDASGTPPVAAKAIDETIEKINYMLWQQSKLEKG
jgi:hypothetical protein